MESCFFSFARFPLVSFLWFSVSPGFPRVFSSSTFAPFHLKKRGTAKQRLPVPLGQRQPVALGSPSRLVSSLRFGRGLLGAAQRGHGGRGLPEALRQVGGRAAAPGRSREVCWWLGGKNHVQKGDLVFVQSLQPAKPHGSLRNHMGFVVFLECAFWFANFFSSALLLFCLGEGATLLK